jgi:hypothetical protein
MYRKPNLFPSSGKNVGGHLRCAVSYKVRTSLSAPHLKHQTMEKVQEPVNPSGIHV